MQFTGCWSCLLCNLRCKWWTKSSCTNRWLNPDMRSFYMNKIWDLNRFKVVSHPSIHTKEFSSQVKSLQASYLRRVKLLAGFCSLCRLTLPCQIRKVQEALSKWGMHFFFHCLEIILMKLNKKLKVKLQQTVNLILPWWELINISTGILMHYLNCTWSFRKLPFLEFSDDCPLVRGFRCITSLFL